MCSEQEAVSVVPVSKDAALTVALHKPVRDGTQLAVLVDPNIVLRRADLQSMLG